MKTYKEYVINVEVDEKNERLVGRTIGNNDPIIVSGNTYREVIKRLKKAIDEYIDFCDKNDIPNDRSYSGNFNFRTTSSLHKAIASEANFEKISINKFVERVLVCVLSEEYPEVKEVDILKEPQCIAKIKRSKELQEEAISFHEKEKIIRKMRSEKVKEINRSNGILSSI